IHSNDEGLSLLHADAGSQPVLETQAGTVQLGVRAEIRPEAPDIGEERAADDERLLQQGAVEEVRPQLDVREQLDPPVVPLAGNSADAVAAAEGESVLVARQLVERHVAELPISDGADGESQGVRDRQVEAQGEVELAIPVRQVIAEPWAGAQLDLMVLPPPGRDLGVA